MKVLICSLLKVPDGDAGSIRQHRLAIMCRDLGCDTLVVGLGQANNMMPQQYNEIEYISLREGGNSTKDKIISHLRYWKRLKQTMLKYHPDVVIMDDLWLIRTIRMKHFCRRRGIQLIHDSVEWYSPEQFKHGKFSEAYLRKDLLNRYFIGKSCSVIAISQYLYEHFRNKGCDCARIPIVITEKDLFSDKNLSDDKVVFTYAGQPGKKDYLHVMLEAFALLPQEMLDLVVFNIVGCTKEQMIEAGISCEVLDKVDSQLIVHGRVSHDQVLDILKRTHFTLLMRSPVQRYARAGFPTKVVESLACSTPVICNITSDLGQYLTDGEDALIVEDCSAQALVKQLSRAITMDSARREIMSKSALDTAKKNFLYSAYLPEMRYLLMKLPKD